MIIDMYALYWNSQNSSYDWDFLKQSYYVEHKYENISWKFGKKSSQSRLEFWLFENK